MSRGPLASAGVAISVVTVAVLVLAGCGRPGNATADRRPSISEAGPASTKADAEYGGGRYEYGERYGSSADYRKHLAECLHVFQRLGYPAYKVCVKY